MKKYKCNCCGRLYKLSFFNDPSLCEDCIDKDQNAVYDKEYETDVIVLKNPSGKTAAVFLDDWLIYLAVSGINMDLLWYN